MTDAEVFWEAVRQREGDLAAAQSIFQAVMVYVTNEMVKVLVPAVVKVLAEWELSQRLAELDGEDYLRVLNGYDVGPEPE